jgi:hypothetical protein
METIGDMPVLFLFVFRFVRLLLSGHQAVAIENVALRMQIAAIQRKRKRPLLTTLDRVFWVSLASLWSDWRHPLIYVQADTVVHWHRERFRRFWAQVVQAAAPASRSSRHRRLVSPCSAARFGFRRSLSRALVLLVLEEARLTPAARFPLLFPRGVPEAQRQSRIFGMKYEPSGRSSNWIRLGFPSFTSYSAGASSGCARM